MKALTLYQPWATLIAIEAKKIETRSWSTSYRGRLAIHVSKRVPPEFRKLCRWDIEPFASFLRGILWNSYPIMDMFDNQHGTRYEEYPKRLHLGCVIATCELYQIDNIKGENYANYITHEEWSFGDYSPGRYAWHLRDVDVFLKPIPAKGALKLWEWDEAEKARRNERENIGLGILSRV